MTEMTKRWNFDMFIAKEIADQADWMIQRGQTYPEGLTAEVWTGLLMEMRDGFRDYHSSPNAVRPVRALGLFVEYFDRLWD